jgi:hypothetical protein
MKSLIAFALVLGSLSTTAFAKNVECYERFYSEAHLRNNPNQSVRQIDLVIVTAGDVIEAHSSILVKELQQGLILSAGCKKTAAGLKCMDETGEKVSFTARKVNGKMRMQVVSEALYSVVESDTSVTLLAGGDDSLFLLNKVRCE